MSERETGNSNQREGGHWGSVSRLNVLIAGTAAIIGIIYGYDLGSIASAILFLQPDLDLSTFMVSAVTYDASSLARYNTVSATSSTVPSRLKGVRCSYILL